MSVAQPARSMEETAMRYLSIRRPSHATVVAYLALFMAMSGTATAATGGLFRLGESNQASRVSTLSNRNGVPLSLQAKLPKPPLRVNSATQVSLLNADLLDGLHGRAFARKWCNPGPKDYIVREGNCTGIYTDVAPIIDNSYLGVGRQGPGGRASCTAGGFVVGGGYALAGPPEAMDVVRASYPQGDRYQATSWVVEVIPEASNAGRVNPGSLVFVNCLRPPLT